jgi:hypothetical protein
MEAGCCTRVDGALTALVSQLSANGTKDPQALPPVPLRLRRTDKKPAGGASRTAAIAADRQKNPQASPAGLRIQDNG